MPKMNLTRNKIINVSPKKVHGILSDMSSWGNWSPWLISDPDASVDVAPDNKSYSWQGNRVGSGNMKITSFDNNSINYDLNFIKPWKSEAKVKFEIKEVDEGSEVSWSMDSSLPWFMFWMKNMMTAFVSNDYDRGLSLLKDYAEDGKIHSKLNWIGETEYPGCDFVGIKRTCKISEMPNVMKTDFENLIAYGATIDGADMSQAFSQYHKFDFVKQIASFTSGLPIKSTSGNLPKDAFVGKLKPVKVYKIEHVGPYDHLGNAWSTIYGMHRNKEIKGIRGYHPFETYGNSPKNTDPKDLITYINFPIKG